MTLKEAKIFLNSIPLDKQDFLLVNGEFGLADDGNTFILKNNEVMTIYVDEKTQEIQFLHQTDKDVKNILLGEDDGNS